jgi:hypothetical protein
MRYRLRTLLMVLALGPPVLAFTWLAAEGLWIVAWDLYYVLSIPQGIKGLS